MILDDYRELFRDFAAFASMKLDDVVMVIDLLTFNLKLTLLGVIFEVDKKGDDASKKHCCDSATGNAGGFKHDTGSSGC